jgi:hypothetical protein
MAAIFLQKDAQEPLKNTYITAMVGPTQNHGDWEVDIWMMSIYG